MSCSWGKGDKAFLLVLSDQADEGEIFQMSKTSLKIPQDCLELAYNSKV